MTCTLAAVGNVFFVRWQRPEVDDMQLIVRELGARRRATGRLLTYIALAPATSEPPDAAARREMPILMNQALTCCDEMHLVMEGTGFKHSVMRSVMAAVFLAGGQRARVTVHARIEDVVRARSSPEIAQALRILALRGLLTDLPASDWLEGHPAQRLPSA